MHLGQSQRPQFQQRRQGPAFRPDGRDGLPADAGGGTRTARLHAEIRDRRSADLSWRGPAAPMDHRIAQALDQDRICLAARDHLHYRAMGLCGGHPDRDRHRLRDLCAQRGADRGDQVQLRRLGISQLPGSLARRPGSVAGPWRQDPGPQSTELPVLRLRQPALPARQDAAAGAAGMPLSAVRLQARHRHRFVSGVQLRPDQAQRARSAASQLVLVHLSAIAEKVLRSSDFITDGRHHHRRTRSCAGMVRERDHWPAPGPRRSKRPICATGSPRSSTAKATPTN